MEAYNSKTPEKIRHSDVGNINYFAGVYKHVLKMAELKIVALILNVFGFTTFCYALFVSFFNVDVFTRSVLSFLAIVFMSVKIVDFIFTRRRKHESENLDIRKKINDEKERELTMRERELLTYEKENDIIRNFNFKK